MASFGTAPNQLLSTVVRMTRERYPDLSSAALVEAVMGCLDVSGQRRADAQSFVEALLLHGTAANGDGFVRVVPGWDG